MVHTQPSSCSLATLKPKDTQAGGCVHPLKGVPAPMQASSHLGRELWSPHSQRMAWKREHGHASWVLCSYCPMGRVMAKGKGAEGPGLLTAPSPLHRRKPRLMCLRRDCVRISMSRTTSFQTSISTSQTGCTAKDMEGGGAGRTRRSGVGGMGKGWGDQQGPRMLGLYWWP